MIEIDLHGQRHDSVREKLESDIILEYNKGNFPIRIITGNSLMMKKIVFTAVENHKFKSKEEPHNSGALIIYE
jgi:DNA-nicking Smr family endonuclease